MDSHGFEEKQGQGDKYGFELSVLRNHRTHGIEYGFHGIHGIKVRIQVTDSTESILTEWARAYGETHVLAAAGLTDQLAAAALKEKRTRPLFNGVLFTNHSPACCEFILSLTIYI
jgi:hypothetical protein